MSDFEAYFHRVKTASCVLFGLGIVLNPLSASSYTLTQTQTGKPIRWHYGQKLFLAGNSSNASHLDPEFIRSAVTTGLQQWKRASAGQFDFDYWQGTNPSIYSQTQEQDGLNALFFASQARKKTDPNVIGYTQVWYNSENGNIIETDIVLNDRDYQLTDSPSDTTSNEGAGRKKVYLNNVITHELGHAIGLSHSNSINSSMLYVEFAEQHRLGCDDWVGARHLYPSTLSGWGGLQGTLLSPTGEPLIGAVITAISKNRGIPLASTLSNQQGFFEFAALEAGNYYFMIEPYQGTPTSIPVPLRAREDLPVCGNKTYPKNFIVESSLNLLKPFRVNGGRQTDAGSIQLQCSELSESTLTPENIAPQSFIDRADVGTKKRYTFFANGRFKITSLAYLLFSPIRVSLSVLGPDGQTLPAGKSSPLYSARRSGFKIEDDSFSGEAYGPVTIEAEIHSQDSKSFPSPAIWPGTIPYFGLIFNDLQDSPSVSLPDNARCDSDEPFEPYRSPTELPIRNSTSTSTRDHLGFCGTAEASELRKQKSISIQTGSILGWFFPFVVAVVCQLFLRVRRAKLKP